jgi:hypothetical protein
MSGTSKSMARPRTGRRTSPAARRTSGSTKRTTPKPLHLLIIECDSAKLAADGLDLGDSAAVGVWFADLVFEGRGAPLGVRTLKVYGPDDLLHGLGAVKEESGRVRSVLVIGHSNATGIMLASEFFKGWDVLGRFLAPLAPTHVALLACSAGGRTAVSELASGLRGVREIVASPAAATKPLVGYLAGWLLSRMRRRRTNQDARLLAQIGLAWLSGNVVFHWTPRELRETTLEALLSDRLLEGAARVVAGRRR